ncbi:SIS domain-containing protein [Enterococcus sp. BWR-S5]|uniref:SIS domain-containing protein n=1 Tax=Enterococcus sp. BWR-S5 TaxID=2787714 RepID=UPI001924F6A6|nr:SIS domain-containing protein [Enterococcus sp. BWR-S5]MBL1227108.1 SIS domain-containing protein [Enterococcus sp. BWR-S5]
MIEKFEQTIKNEINELFDTMDYQALNEAESLVLASESEGGRVHVTGIGKPSYVSGYIASLLSSTGTPAYFLDGTEAVHGSSGQVRVGDVVIAISNSGETVELLYTIRTLKANGAKIIGVSRNHNSSLSQLSDVSLCTCTKEEGDDLNKPPRASIIKQTLLLQTLSILLQKERKLKSEDYVVWHPGGAIGESLGA